MAFGAEYSSNYGVGVPQYTAEELLAAGVPQELIDKYLADPTGKPAGYVSQYMNNNTYRDYYDKYGTTGSGTLMELVNSGQIDPYTAQTMAANGGRLYELSPDQEKALNNQLSRYNSQNNLMWNAEQLQQLGLSSAGVLQTGGVNTAVDMSNQSNNRLLRRQEMANSLINMAGRMASSAIHGGALAAVKGAASSAASMVANSAYRAMRYY